MAPILDAICRTWGLPADVKRCIEAYAWTPHPCSRMILEAKADHRWVYKRGRARYTQLRFPRLVWFESMYNESAEAFEAGDLDELMTLIMDIDHVYRRDHDDFTSRELQHIRTMRHQLRVWFEELDESDLFF